MDKKYNKKAIDDANGRLKEEREKLDRLAAECLSSGGALSHDPLVLRQNEIVTKCLNDLETLERILEEDE